MNLFLVILLQQVLFINTSINTINLTLPTNHRSPLNGLIKRILVELYVGKLHTAKIFCGLEEQKNYRMTDFLSNAIEDISNNVKIALTLETVTTDERHINSVVAFVDDFDSFLKFFNRLRPNHFKVNGLYTIALMAGKIEEIEEIFRLMWTKKISNVLILFSSGLSVKGFTFYPFNATKCGDTTAFELKISSADLRDVFADKLSDLKNCPIRVAAPQIVPFIMQNEKKEFIGRDLNVIEAISKALNFMLEIKLSDDAAFYGYLLENGSSAGAFKDLLNAKTDMIISDYFLEFIRLAYLDSSMVYYNSKIVFVVPPGRTLKSIEKILQPFRNSVWILLTSFFLLMFKLILVTRSTVVNEIFGARSPYLSIISIALGVSLPSFSSKNYVRLLIMSFILFSLVLQAAYQGLLFTFIQADGKLSEAQSIDEMVEKDFKFHTIGLVNDIMKHHPRINKR